MKGEWDAKIIKYPQILRKLGISQQLKHRKYQRNLTWAVLPLLHFLQDCLEPMLFLLKIFLKILGVPKFIVVRVSSSCIRVGATHCQGLPYIAEQRL